MMADCLGILEESSQEKNRNPVDTMERMLSQMKSRIPSPPQFFLCILPQRKNNDLYGDCVILVLMNDSSFYVFYDAKLDFVTS